MELELVFSAYQPRAESGIADDDIEALTSQSECIAATLSHVLELRWSLAAILFEAQRLAVQQRCGRRRQEGRNRREK
jgi:hypothetical protein